MKAAILHGDFDIRIQEAPDAKSIYSTDAVVWVCGLLSARSVQRTSRRHVSKAGAGQS